MLTHFSIPTRALACLWLLVATPLMAQGPHVHIAVGPVRQGSPVTTESGTTALIAVSLPTFASFAFVPEAEFSQTHVDANISICHFIDTAGNCFHRTGAERMYSLGSAVDWHPFAKAPVRPHVAAGVARMWAGSTRNAGASSSFFAPHVVAGLNFGRKPALSVDLRVRRLDRWGSLRPSGQGALLVGLVL